MEKVKLTREQADAIDYIVDLHYKEITKLKSCESDEIKDEILPVLDLTENEINEAFFEGYEVEPEFNIGDWVVDIYEGVTKIHSKEKRFMDRL